MTETKTARLYTLPAEKHGDVVCHITQKVFWGAICKVKCGLYSHCHLPSSRFWDLAAGICSHSAARTTLMLGNRVNCTWGSKSKSLPIRGVNFHWHHNSCVSDSNAKTFIAMHLSVWHPQLFIFYCKWRRFHYLNPLLFRKCFQKSQQSSFSSLHDKSCISSIHEYYNDNLTHLLSTTMMFSHGSFKMRQL